jgi:hypothetical protein
MEREGEREKGRETEKERERPKSSKMSSVKCRSYDLFYFLYA